MRHIVWVMLILVVISSVTGCARAKRIANDVDWVVFDGEPSRDN